jgi:hypothetical protein
MFGQFRLDEMFTEDELTDLMALARNRIISSFIRATEKRPRQPTPQERATRRRGVAQPYYRTIGTDNYVIGIEGLQSELARHITRKMKRFVYSKDLPEWSEAVSPKIGERLIGQIEYKVLLAELNRMCELSEVWYDDSRGIWQICQTAVDQYHDMRTAVRATPPRNDRSYHGRPRRQTRARGIPAGTSIGLAGSQGMTA